MLVFCVLIRSHYYIRAIWGWKNEITLINICICHEIEKLKNLILHACIYHVCLHTNTSKHSKKKLCKIIQAVTDVQFAPALIFYRTHKSKKWQNAIIFDDRKLS